ASCGHPPTPVSMSLSFHRRSGPSMRGACLLAVACASACTDAGEDPTAVLVTESTHPAIQMALELPSLPALAAEAGIEDRLPQAIERWSRSWTEAPELAAGSRSAAYDESAWPLAEALDAASVEAALRRLEAVLAAAGDIDAAALPEAVATRLAGARVESEA